MIDVTFAPVTYDELFDNAVLYRPFKKILDSMRYVPPAIRDFAERHECTVTPYRVDIIDGHVVVTDNEVIVAPLTLHCPDEETATMARLAL